MKMQMFGSKLFTLAHKFASETRENEFPDTF